MSIIWKRGWARKFAPFLGERFMRVFTVKPGYDMCRNKLFVPEGNLLAIHFAEQEYAQLLKKWTDFLMQQDITSYAKQFEQQFKDFLAWAKKAGKMRFGAMSDDQLADFLEDMSKRLADFAEIQFLGFITIEGPVKDVENRLSSQPDGPQVLQAIATPYRETHIAKAYDELLKLVAAGKADDAALAAYAKKYAWLPMYDFVDLPWTANDFKQQIVNIKDAAAELRSNEELRKANLARYKSFVKSIKDESLKKLVELAHHCAYLKEMRDDYRRPAYYALLPFWKEVAKRTSLSLLETNYLIADELVQVLRTGKNPFVQQLKARMGTFAIVLKENKLTMHDGAEALKIAKLVETKHGDEIRGMVACKGKVRGTVRVVYHQGEFNKFKRDDILVTAMTHPEFMPIMKIAKAIVTDEGGITCHAAIISRELKIPCIIGTKNATKALKDGDIVEVDAEKGVVRKL